jgi:predicted RNase H-like HicB family nuclease
MKNPQSGESFSASVTAGKRHIRLDVEYGPAGWYARVVELDGNTEVEWERADTFETAKERAEEIAKAYLAEGDFKPPDFEWKKH